MVCTPRDTLPPSGACITVGGKFAGLVDSVADCEEFDLTVAESLDEPTPVEVTAVDTIPHATSTGSSQVAFRQFVGRSGP